MFGERLKNLRLQKEMSQKELGNLLKISPSTVGMYEQGRRAPDTTTLTTLADLFNVSIDYLLGRTDDKNIKIITKSNLYNDPAFDEDDRFAIIKEADISIEELKEIITFIKKMKNN